MNPFGVLATLLVVAHVAFAIFVVAGGLLVLRWPRLAWVHLPAVVWGVYVEVSGKICPLTPFENQMRARAGLDEYSGDFIARYVFPALYPEGLTLQAQFVVGILVLIVNVALYGWLLRARRAAAQAESMRVDE